MDKDSSIQNIDFSQRKQKKNEQKPKKTGIIKKALIGLGILTAVTTGGYKTAEYTNSEEYKSNQLEIQQKNYLLGLESELKTYNHTFYENRKDTFDALFAFSKNERTEKNKRLIEIQINSIDKDIVDLIRIYERQKKPDEANVVRGIQRKFEEYKKKIRNTYPENG